MKHRAPDAGAGGCQLLFVYGSLRAGASRMHSRLCAASAAAGTGTLQGRLYSLGGYPGATPSADTGEQVFGELYRMEQPEVLLAELDRYEECSSEYPQPHEYRRELVMIRASDGCRVQAWTYLYNLPVTGLARIASGDYLAAD